MGNIQEAIVEVAELENQITIIEETIEERQVEYNALTISERRNNVDIHSNLAYLHQMLFERIQRYNLIKKS